MEARTNLPMIFGHRGASGYKPDNTIAAFDLAIEQGADGLESDVKITTDGVTILFHDSECTISDETGKLVKVKISSLHSSDLGKVVLDGNEKIPTVRDFFKKYSDATTKASKPLLFSFDFNYNATEETVRLAQEFNCEEKLYMCANNSFMFRRLRNVSQKIPLVASNSIRKYTFQTFLHPFSKYQLYNVKIFNIKAANFREEYLPIITDAGFDFFIWDLHDEARLRKYLPYRPTLFHSNYPDLALKIRTELFGE